MHSPPPADQLVDTANSEPKCKSGAGGCGKLVQFNQTVQSDLGRKDQNWNLKWSEAGEEWEASRFARDALNSGIW